MAFVCYDTRTHIYEVDVQAWLLHRYIVVAIKYIVFEGVLYNGFLLFIKAEGVLQSAAVLHLTTRIYLELCRSRLPVISLTDRMRAIRGVQKACVDLCMSRGT